MHLIRPDHNITWTRSGMASTGPISNTWLLLKNTKQETCYHINFSWFDKPTKRKTWVCLKQLTPKYYLSHETISSHVTQRDQELRKPPRRSKKGKLETETREGTECTWERMQSSDYTWLREMESPIKAHDLSLIMSRNFFGHTHVFLLVGLSNHKKFIW